MGLDSYWRVYDAEDDGPTQEVPEVDLDVSLCGGMLSGHGAESFRGKVYNDFIEELTDETLYQLCIRSDTIKTMAGDLEDHMEGQTSVWRLAVSELWGLTLQEKEQQAIDLVKMFRAYADAGACLVGWW